MVPEKTVNNFAKLFSSRHVRLSRRLMVGLCGFLKSKYYNANVSIEIGITVLCKKSCLLREQ